MNTKPLGPGRQIADKNYYLTLLRERVTDISNEIESMRKEIDKTQSDNATYGQLERKYGDVYKEVRALEGQLADYNLAQDKMRTNTDVHEIQDTFERLRGKNEFDRKQVDDTFMRVAAVEKQTREYEEKVGDIHRVAAERLAALGDEVRQEYQDLQEEGLMLSKAINEKELRMQDLNLRIERMEMELKSPEFQVHTRGLELRKNIDHLRAKKSELEEEINAHLSPEDLKNRLQTKVKDLTKAVSDLERNIKETEAAVEHTQEAVRNKENDLLEARKNAQKAKKYEAVYERDRKMQEFIDRYPENLSQENRKLDQLKNSIVALMKKISKNMAQADALPDVDKFGDMKSDLAFKETNMQNSKTTLSLLESDLQQRKDELDKISSLDTKITLELQSLKDKMVSMKKEMTTFKSEEQLQAESVEAKKGLSVQRQQWKRKRDAIKSQVQVLSQSFDKKKRDLAANEGMKKLDTLETKLRSAMATVYDLDSFIAERRRESSYTHLKQEVVQMTQEMNSLILSQYRKA